MKKHINQANTALKLEPPTHFRTSLHFSFPHFVCLEYLRAKELDACARMVWGFLDANIKTSCVRRESTPLHARAHVHSGMAVTRPLDIWNAPVLSTTRLLLSGFPGSTSVTALAKSSTLLDLPGFVKLQFSLLSVEKVTRDLKKTVNGLRLSSDTCTLLYLC